MNSTIMFLQNFLNLLNISINLLLLDFFCHLLVKSYQIQTNVQYLWNTPKKLLIFAKYYLLKNLI